LSRSQIAFKVAIEDARPEIPVFVSPLVRPLIEHCWPFAEIVDRRLGKAKRQRTRSPRILSPELGKAALVPFSLVD
jgi:hypothetical protein